jgi:hypothetical protein
MPLVRTDVSEEHIASIFRVTILKILVTVKIEMIYSFYTSVLITRATRRHIPNTSLKGAQFFKVLENHEPLLQQFRLSSRRVTYMTRDSGNVCLISS